MPIEKTERLTENLDLADHLLTASSLRFRCANGWWLLPHRVVLKNTPPHCLTDIYCVSILINLIT